NVQPELDQDGAVVHQPTLELVDLGIGLAPEPLRDHMVATVLEHTGVPGVVEDDHVSFARKGELVAPEEVVAQFEGGGGASTIHLIEARIEQLGELLDNFAAAASVPPLETHNDGDIGFLDGVLEEAQAALQSLDAHGGGG